MTKDPNWVPPWEDLPVEGSRQEEAPLSSSGKIVMLLETEGDWRHPHPKPQAHVFDSWATTPAEFQGCENTFIREDGETMEAVYERAEKYLKQRYKFRQEHEAKQKKG